MVINTYTFLKSGLFILILNCFCAVSLQAKSDSLLQNDISGTVTDSTTGDPLPGVNILVKGTTNGTSTDKDGKFQLEVESLRDTLIFSFIGYGTQEIPIAGRTQLDIILTQKVYLGDELVVNGYQSQRKVDMTGAVSIAKTDDIKNTPVTNPLKSLQGHVPGVFVETSGAPSGGAEVHIRGISTLNNNNPLYVIDGVPTTGDEAQMLDPDNIKSMQVLKDAAAASIYGSRASNGVIVITTKQGGKQKFQLNYSSKLTTSQYATKIPVLNTRERGQVLWQAAINDDIDPSTLPIYDYEWHRDSEGLAVLDKVIIPDTVGQGMPASDTDWFDETTRTGIMQVHNLSMSTGSDRGSARMSLRYLNNKYIHKWQNFKRYSARINSHYEFLDGKLDIGENFTVANSINKGFGGSIVNETLIFQPILPVHTVDGGWAGPPGAGFDDRQNPARLLYDNRWDQDNAINGFGNLYTDLALLQNLHFNANFGIDWKTTDIRDIQKTYQTGFLSRTTNSLRKTTSNDFNWTFHATLEYKLERNKHNATFLAGTEATKNSYSDLSAYREDFALETLDYFMESAGSGKQTVAGNKSGYSLLSYFGKLNYSYNDKYLASATLRYDGSSKFGRNNRFGTFPAFSVGWRVSNERFIQNNAPFISNLKLRASWGVTGNQSIASDARFTLYEALYGEQHRAFNSNANGTAYDIQGNDSGILSSGFLKTQTGNQDLRWEETSEINTGVDFGFFEQALVGSFDYFQRHTKNILISPPYIAVQGNGGNQYVNGATMETNGFEAALTYNHQNGPIRYSITGNVGHYRDQITYLPESVLHAYPGNTEKTILGHSVNSIFGYVADGIFQNQQEVDEHAEQPGKGVGRLRFKDLNDDGVINSKDQKYLGVQAPQYEFGLRLQGTYKGFDVSAFIQGVADRQVYDEYKIYTDFTSIWNGSNFGKRTLDAWTPKNPGSNIPAVTEADNNNESRLSSYFVENGDYMKLRELSVGYTFDHLLTLKEVRVFATGQNLLTVKDTKGSDAFTSPDPENPNYGFPRPRMFTLGINLSL